MHANKTPSDAILYAWVVEQNTSCSEFQYSSIIVSMTCRAPCKNYTPTIEFMVTHRYILSSISTKFPR